VTRIGLAVPEAAQCPADRRREAVHLHPEELAQDSR
jgi:hypothetical protein